MNKPTLSIIVPAYNEAETLSIYLPELIQYVVKNNWAIIIVNDGSNDNTQEILSKYNSIKNLKKQFFKEPKFYSYKMASFINDELPNESLILTMAYSCGYYLERKLTMNGYLHEDFIYDKMEYKKYMNKLNNNEITHILINHEIIDDFKMRYGNSILLEKEFQEQFLTELFKDNEQILYKINFNVEKCEE